MLSSTLELLAILVCVASLRLGNHPIKLWARDFGVNDVRSGGGASSWLSESSIFSRQAALSQQHQHLINYMIRWSHGFREAELQLQAQVGPVDSLRTIFKASRPKTKQNLGRALLHRPTHLPARPSSRRRKTQNKLLHCDERVAHGKERHRQPPGQRNECRKQNFKRAMTGASNMHSTNMRMIPSKAT